MREYIKKFDSASAADQYMIDDIPFITSVATDPIQNLHCTLANKKLINDNGIVRIEESGLEMVDLGLSVLWAKCNLGAETETEYGDYYAWGEVETKSNYSWDTYTRHTNRTYTDSNKKVFIKYIPINKESTFWAGIGSADNKLTLDLGADGDDIVNKLYGGNYRMPTETEFDELLDTTKVTNVWVTDYKGSGINGREFTSLINGNKLFIPAAGYYYNSSSIKNANSDGCYWSSNLPDNYPVGGRTVCFSSYTIAKSSYYRCSGYSVRPVKSK